MRRPVVARFRSPSNSRRAVSYRSPVGTERVLVEVDILQALHLNTQPDVNDKLLEQSSTSMKHIEGTSSGVGMIAVKGGDRHQIMDSISKKD